MSSNVTMSTYEYSSVSLVVCRHFQSEIAHFFFNSKTFVFIGYSNISSYFFFSPASPIILLVALVLVFANFVYFLLSFKTFLFGNNYRLTRGTNSTQRSHALTSQRPPGVASQLLQCAIKTER